jgi:hypothetical protein
MFPPVQSWAQDDVERFQGSGDMNIFRHTRSLSISRILSVFSLSGTLALAACFGPSLSKPDEQKKLDEQFYGTWLAMSRSQGDDALKAQHELDALVQTIHLKYVDHLVANWVCKPWTLDGKEIVLKKVEKGVSFECINSDGFRGSVFTITLQENTLTEPFFNGYVIRFSGEVEQIALSPEIGKSFMMYVRASSLEILARSHE